MTAVIDIKAFEETFNSIVLDCNYKYGGNYFYIHHDYANELIKQNFGEIKEEHMFVYKNTHFNMYDVDFGFIMYRLKDNEFDIYLEILTNNERIVKNIIE